MTYRSLIKALEKMDSEDTAEVLMGAADLGPGLTMRVAEDHKMALVKARRVNINPSKSKSRVILDFKAVKVTD